MAKSHKSCASEQICKSIDHLLPHRRLLFISFPLRAVLFKHLAVLSQAFQACEMAQSSQHRDNFPK